MPGFWVLGIGFQSDLGGEGGVRGGDGVSGRGGGGAGLRAGVTGPREPEGPTPNVGNFGAGGGFGGVKPLALMAPFVELAWKEACSIQSSSLELSLTKGRPES